MEPTEPQFVNRWQPVTSEFQNAAIPAVEAPQAMLHELPSSKAAPTESTRPLPVTLVAIYQFLRSTILFGSVAFFYQDMNSDMDSHPALRMLIYLVTRKNIGQHGAEVSTVVNPLLFLALYYAAAGVGLLLLINWARRASIAMCVAASLRMVFLIVLLRAHQTDMPLYMQALLGALVLLDVLVISSLIHEGKHFGVSD